MKGTQPKDSITYKPDGADKNNGFCCLIVKGPQKPDGRPKGPPLSIFARCGGFAKNDDICGGCGHEYCDCH